MNTLKLNGKDVTFEPGKTILEIARNNGVVIPTLCHMQCADHKEVCRICVVEVQGVDRLLPACATPATDAMTVSTHSEVVLQARKLILELLLAHGIHNCLFCESNGDCTLQDLAYEYGVKGVTQKPNMEQIPLDVATPMIQRDFNKCVLCGRCVAACNDIQVNDSIPFPFGRRGNAQTDAGWFPVADYDRCVHCGECVQACPVGALTERKAQGKGLIWQTQKIRTTCPYCGVGCQIWLHTKDNRVVKVTGVEDALPNRGRLCVKGRFAYDFIHSPDRLTTPLIKENGSFREANWAEALDLVAARFLRIKDKDGPQSLAGLTSARATNEENYLMQKLVRTGFGTNNIDHCARL